MPPSTVSCCFSVTGARKGGPWLGCGDFPAMGENSRGWLTTVEALDTPGTHIPSSIFVVNSFTSFTSTIKIL